MTNSYQPTREERQELADLQAYLRGHAEAGTTPPEGSLSRVIRQASPNVRAHIQQSKEFAKFVREDGGRTMPFAERTILDESRLDKTDKALLSRLDEEEISAGLMDRMGTTAQQQRLHAAPATMRDHIEAAFGDDNVN